MTKKSTVSKKKVSQKQKQKQSIHININSNNKRVNKPINKQPQTYPQYGTPQHHTTVIGSTGRGSEVIQQPAISNDISNLLKTLVQSNKDFSGVGKLFSKVNQLENRQSSLESRLTDQFNLFNDISDNEHTHYNNEDRSQASSIQTPPIHNFYSYPNYFQSDNLRSASEQNNDQNILQIGYYPPEEPVPEDYDANMFESETPNVINFEGQPSIDEIINQPEENKNDESNPITYDNTFPNKKQNKYPIEPLKYITNPMRQEYNPLQNFTFPKQEEPEDLTDFIPQENMFGQHRNKMSQLNELGKTMEQQKELEKQRNEEIAKKQQDEIQQLRNEKHAKFTENQNIINKLEQKGITPNEIQSNYDNILKEMYRVGSKDQLSLAKRNANVFLQSIGHKHLANQNKENSINILKSQSVIDKIDELKKQLGLVKNEFPETKEVIPLENRTKTLQNIQTPDEKQPTKKKKEPKQESTTNNDNNKKPIRNEAV